MPIRSKLEWKSLCHLLQWSILEYYPECLHLPNWPILEQLFLHYLPWRPSLESFTQCLLMPIGIKLERLLLHSLHWWKNLELHN
jgi:hypothetical protein